MFFLVFQWTHFLIIILGVKSLMDNIVISKKNTAPKKNTLYITLKINRFTVFFALNTSCLTDLSCCNWCRGGCSVKEQTLRFCLGALRYTAYVLQLCGMSNFCHLQKALFLPSSLLSCFIFKPKCCQTAAFRFCQLNERNFLLCRHLCSLLSGWPGSHDIWLW